ncbi:MAG: helix-turn-helix domain-containing protein [Dehalococcoidales bacterium]|nr:helix-turn-helix domain-containing protein [Dehalococcoidales bacterium]
MEYAVSTDVFPCAVLSDELNLVRNQVADYLMNAAGTNPQAQRISQNDLAMELGTSREMVNHALASLKREGAIKIVRNKIMVDIKILRIILFTGVT